MCECVCLSVSVWSICCGCCFSVCVCYLASSSTTLPEHISSSLFDISDLWPVELRDLRPAGSFRDMGPVEGPESIKINGKPARKSLHMEAETSNAASLCPVRPRWAP